MGVGFYMPKVGIVSDSFEQILESLKVMQEDCVEEDVDKVSSVVQALFDQELNFMKLKAVQGALNQKVDKIPSEEERPNLVALTKKVNSVVKEIQRKTAQTLIHDFKRLKSLPEMVGLNLSVVLSIAKECLKIDLKTTLENLHEFPFFHTPEGRKGILDLLTPWAKRESKLVLNFLFKSDQINKAEDKSTVFSLLKNCIIFDEDIFSEESLEAIVVQLTEREFCDLVLGINLSSAERACYLFCNFPGKLEGKPIYRLRIAVAIAEHEPSIVISALDYFKIENLKHQSAFILKLAQHAPKDFLRSFRDVRLFPEDIRYQMALACAKGDPNQLISKIERFDIRITPNFFFILKTCAIHGWCAGDEEVFKKFQISDSEQKQEIITSSITNQNMSSVSEIEKADLPSGIIDKLVLLALGYNYLHNSLTVENEARFKEAVPPKLEILAKRTPDRGDDEFSKLLNLKTERSKVIAFLAIEIFGFSMEDQREQKVIQKICQCGSGQHAFGLLEIMEGIRRTFQFERFLSFISSDRGVVDEALVVPALFGVYWLNSKNIDTVEELKIMLFSSPKVRKKLAENGPTLRIALNAFLQMKKFEDAGSLNQQEKFMILCLILSHADETHFAERMSVVETLFSISEASRLKPLLPSTDGGRLIHRAITALEDVKSESFPLDKKIIEKQREIDEFLVLNSELREQASELRKEAEQAIKRSKPLEKKQAALKEEIDAVDAARNLGEMPTEEAAIKRASLEEEIQHLEREIQLLKEEKTAKIKKAKGLGVDTEETKLKRELQALEKENVRFKKTSEAKAHAAEIQAKEVEIQDSITAAFRKAVMSLLLSDVTLQDDLKEIEDLDRKFVQTLGAMRSPNGWKVYQVGILRLSSKALNKALKDFILGYLKGTLRQERYQDNCPHNHHMIENCPIVWKAWSSEDKGREIDILHKKYHILNTDDPEDLFLSGTDIEGSCQNIRASTDYNKCLLAYTNDGRNRMIAIKDPATGRIKARTIFRLLWHSELQRPVLHIELVYPKSGLQKDFKSALWDYAVEEAKRLKCPLYCSTDLPNTEKCEGQSLVSMKGRAPFEYVDAGSGIRENGEYEILSLFLFKATEEFLASQ